MSRIAEQHRRAVPPGRYRIAVDHRIFENAVGLFDQGRYVEPIPDPGVEMVDEFVDAHLPEPPALLPTLTAVHGDLSNPVHDREAGARIRMGDRIKDNPLAMGAEADEGGATAYWLGPRRAAPHH